MYGLFGAARAAHPKALVAADVPASITVKTAIVTAVALTWLNPQVCLVTVIFLGSVANQQGATEQWWWAGGAIDGSFLGFFGLGFGARLLSSFLARLCSKRNLDGIIAVVMVALGLRMALGV